MDERIGILTRLTQSEGIGGKIKQEPDDFVVEEVWGDHVVEAKAFRGIDFDQKVKGKGEYLHFTLEKHDWNINKLLKRLGNWCGVSRKRFSVSGTKDKFARTAQRVALWNVQPDRLAAFKSKDIWLYDFELKSEGLELGQHSGNQFTIKIRDCGKDADRKIKATMKECGGSSPNFFGPQRFGNRLNSHLVGKALLNENFEEAAKIYLTDTHGEASEKASEARRWLEANWGEFKEGLKRFPVSLRPERTLLSHLEIHSHDFANAFRKLPKGLFKIFVHAYQSYLFNLVASEMIKQGGADENSTAPVYGYDIQLTSDLEKQVLNGENLSLEDFRIGSLPEASGKGIRRKVLVPVKEFEWKGGVASFTLPVGAYATVFLDELMKVG